VSKIQEALRKLRSQGVDANDQKASKSKLTSGRVPESVIPIASSKKIQITGERFHLDQEHLIHLGLLAPLDQAIPVAGEFRRIKRPLIDNFSKNKSVSDDHMNLILVASALPGAGKTFCSVNTNL